MAVGKLLSNVQYTNHEWAQEGTGIIRVLVALIAGELIHWKQNLPLQYIKLKN